MPLRVWIDATMPDSERLVFGMSLLERHLQGLRETGAEFRDVHVELAPGSPIPDSLPAALVESLPLSWSQEAGTPGERFERALQTAENEPVLALSADTVVDTRVVAHLCNTRGSFAFIHGEARERGAVLLLDGELAEGPGATDSLVEISEQAIRNGSVKAFATSGFSGYITMLRRDLPPYLFRIPDAESRDRAERFLFWSNYKGSTDFMTKYVYPPLVWAFVRPLARWRVHPNWITGFDWLATVAAVPLFANGVWMLGLFLAYLMSVFDSVDGKLARLTYTSSKFGGFLDHGLDVIHPPIWYMAWAWWLGGASVTSGPFQASLWLLGFYIQDRIVTGIFKARHGTSIHDFTPLDERVRTFISRRNVNLILFTAALLFDWIVPGVQAAVATFYFIVAWQVVSAAWHFQRLVQFWNTRR